MPPDSTSPSVHGLPCRRIRASQWNFVGSLSAAHTPRSADRAASFSVAASAGSRRSQSSVWTSTSGRRARTQRAARSALRAPTAERGKRWRSMLCGLYTSGSTRVSRVTRVSRQTMSRTGMPPLPAPTWNRWAMAHPVGCRLQLRPPRGEAASDKTKLLRLRQRPFAGLVPDLVAGEPAPGCLDGEDTREAGRVPAAGRARAALTPQTKGLALEQVGAVLERRHDARLGRHGREARRQPRLQVVNVMPGLQRVAQDQRAADADQANLVRLVAPLVVLLHHGDLDAQEAPLPGFAVEEAHES